MSEPQPVSRPTSATPPLARLLVLLGAIGLLLAIVWPMLGRSRHHGEGGSRIRCASNLRQIGQGILLYCNDSHGLYPPTLSVVLATQDITPDFFVCPQTQDTPLYDASNAQSTAPPTTQQIIATDPLATDQHCSYVYVGKGLTYDSNADLVVAFEPPANHDTDGTNVLYVDGHVTWEQKAIAEQLNADLKAGVWPIVVRPPGDMKPVR